MFVLFETARGFAILKVLKMKKLRKPENLYKQFRSAEKAHKFIKLIHFEKFRSMEEALETTRKSVNGKMSKRMKKVLRKILEENEELAVADAKLGSAISSKLNVSCISNSATAELMRCIRGHLDYVLEGLMEKELTAMKLGIADGLARYKIKVNPEKIEKMVIEAVSTLDDIDKELNTYIMMCKELYSWHFPELSKVIHDNQLYMKITLAVGFKENASKVDLSYLLSKEDEQKVKNLAAMSVGIKILGRDLTNIMNLCKDILELQDYQEKLCVNLKNQMVAIAPNVTSLVGELFGARLIAHAGSLINLTKLPVSIIQVLSAKKTLYKSMRKRNNSLKCGLIYPVELIGQSQSGSKGKVSRTLAAKIALASRVDAFGEKMSNSGLEHQTTLERSQKTLPEGEVIRIGGTGRPKTKFDSYQSKGKVSQYKSDDSTLIHKAEHWHKKK